MSSLYELTADYEALLALAEDPDIDEDAFRDTLDGIAGAIEDKAENYAKVIRMLEGDAAACDAESKRLKRKKTTIENNIKRMKSTLQYAMETTGKTKFKTQLFSFNIQRNRDSVEVDEQYVENIPKRFLTFHDPEANRVELYKALKAGDKEAEAVAHLEPSKSLRIK